MTHPLSRRFAAQTDLPGSAPAPTVRPSAEANAAAEDEASYRNYRDRYRAISTSLGFEGHMKWAEAMP